MALEPVNLCSEYQESPLGLDVPRPRLSWALASDEPGQRQTAYRILVSSTAARLSRGDADLWDSGRIESDEALHIPYGGLACFRHPNGSYGLIRVCTTSCVEHLSDRQAGSTSSGWRSLDRHLLYENFCSMSKAGYAWRVVLSTLSGRWVVSSP